MKKRITKKLSAKFDKLLLTKGYKPLWYKKCPPIKNSISLIVPCFNMASFIDDFMNSILAQTTGLDNLEILLIDDGSTDNTASKARWWATAYPDTVRYHYQDNVGLSGARNTGLSLAKNTWISFPDPDDFFHPQYLQHVDRAISDGKRRKISAVFCRLIRYHEKLNEFRDDHGLGGRFRTGRVWKKANELDTFIQLSVASAFLKRKMVLNSDLRFETQIKPGFEDASLVNKYIIRNSETSIIFLPKAEYFYRKRADEGSMQDTAKNKVEFFTHQPKHGWLPLLNESAEKKGLAQKFIQRTVLYDAIGQFRLHLRRPQTLSILTKDQKEEYFDTFKKVFEKISHETVSQSNLPSLYEDLKTGIFHLFYNKKRWTTNFYIEDIDRELMMMKITFFSNSEIDVSTIRRNGSDIAKKYNKCNKSTFVGREFFYRHSYWVEFSEGEYTVSLQKQNSRFRVKNTSFSDKIDASEIEKFFPSHKKKIFLNKWNKSWLLMDRIDKADDNAEHFYRYIKSSKPYTNAHFILSKSSPDWDRLKGEGFKLIEYGSKEHRRAIRSAEFLISSHGDGFIRKPFEPNFMKKCNFRFAFIQHGVTKDEQSEWFNSINPSILATSTLGEFDSIVDRNSNYTLSEKETRLTGFPRHDKLLLLPQTAKTIFLMPTWRESLLTISTDGNRKLKNGFRKSAYFENWIALLSAPELYAISKSRSLTIKFCPHPNLAPFLKEFDLPNHIEVVNTSKIPSLQPLFAEMAVMITDYSSVAFDAGIMNKPVVYFQFDEDEFFRGHIYQRGYFDYRDHGFGPVTIDTNSTLRAIQNAVSQSELPMYESRRLSTFAYRDSNSCERLFSELSSLSSHGT